MAQHPHLSVEDALTLITLDSDHIGVIGTTSASLDRQQLAVRKQMLEALSQRPDLTSEQTEHIAKMLAVIRGL